MKYLFLVLGILFTTSVCSQTSRILVLGEGIDGEAPAVLDKLQSDLAANPEAVILTGDWLRNKHRVNKNPLLDSKIGKLLAGYSGPVYLLPGEYEYGPYQNNSIDQLAGLEESLSELPGNFTLVPSDGCPGPLVVPSDTWVLVFINTSRFLHQGEKIPFSECGQEDASVFFSTVSDVLEEYKDRPAFVVGHHPVRSRGPHAGYFPWYRHVLPPVLGSVYAGFRKYIGGLQDLRDERYRQLVSSLQESFDAHEGVYYISGHESYFHYDIVSEQQPRSQIISGAFKRNDYAKPVESSNDEIQLSDYTFVASEPGYVNIAVDRLYSSRATDKVTVAYRMAENDKVSVSYYQGYLYNVSEVVIDTSYAGATTTAYATDRLKKDMTKPGLMGLNYRAEWETPISGIPVFDLGTERGGLKIIKKGGGQQTRSLRLEADNGRQYVLRSIEKFPEKAVPIELRGTIAEEIIADQISASHPYGALAIPKLADAAGVYHTNPSIVYLPDDPRLGEYREDFGDGVYLYEERPDDDHWEDAAFFGNAPDIVSTADVVEKLREDDDHIIDEDQVIRSRLFDIWIGDWDRHDDQWRWAKYKDEEGIKHYRPIPRDRDQAFFWSDGRLLKLGSRKWGIPKFQGFNNEIRDVTGLAFNARFFDRTFLTASEKSDWMSIARELQSSLTDEVIEAGVNDLPPEIFEIHGAEIISKLKRRREDLLVYASDYYDFLAETVVVTGSEEAEEFLIKYLSRDTTLVEVYRVKEKSGERKYRSYSRHFVTDETDEIWLYGFESDDRFYFEGDASNAPKIRVIGGKGHDSLAAVNNRHKSRILLYDKNNTATAGSFKDHRSDDQQVNQYNRYWFKYNLAMPIVTGGFNPDDGIFLGGGVLIQKHGFRKEPFASQHKITASFAPLSASYNFAYDGEWSNVFRFTDVVLHADFYEPSFGDFFYGFGNRTQFNDSARDENRQFYRVRYSQRILKPMLRTSSRNGYHTLKYGGFYRSVKIRRDQNAETQDRFINLYSEFIGRGEESEFPLLDTRRHYFGASASYELDLRDSKNFPRNGMYWYNEFNMAWQVGEEEFEHRRLQSAMSFYFTFGGALKATFAGRVGGQLNWGDFEFYQAARLGGTSTLRGYRKLRFAGDQSFFYNLELRVQVLSFKSVLFPALAGFYVFRDQGRVWSDNPDTVVEDREKAIWHRGLGGGIWIAPLGQLAISADYSWSNDDEGAFFVRFGFFF